MHVILAHSGHSHGADPSEVALLVFLVVLGVVAAGMALHRTLARRGNVRGRWP